MVNATVERCGGVLWCDSVDVEDAKVGMQVWGVSRSEGVRGEVGYVGL